MPIEMHLASTARLGAQLHRLTFDYWKVGNSEAIALLHLLNKSDAPHAVTFRQHLALTDMVAPTRVGVGVRLDMDHLFEHILTPKFMMQMIEELQDRRELPPRQAHAIEEAMLACVDREGRWKPVT